MRYIVSYYQQPYMDSSDVHFNNLVRAKQSKMHKEWNAQNLQTKRYHEMYIRAKLIGCFLRLISWLLLSVCASPLLHAHSRGLSQGHDACLLQNNTNVYAFLQVLAR